MENKFVSVHGHQIRYIESGLGAPVILLNGLGFNASADQWRPLISYLEGDFHLIALDQLGWGWSDRPIEGYSFPLLVSILEGFIETLGVEHPIVAGHTLGGWTAALLAHERPELIDKLVLCTTAGLNPTAPRQPAGFELPDAAKTRVALEGTFAGSIPVTDAMVEDELKRQARDGVAQSYLSILRFVNDPEVRSTWSLVQRLGEVRCPTLAIWGADDTIIVPDYGVQAAELLPNGHFVAIPAAGHVPFASKPAEFAEIFRAFVKAT